MIAVLTDVKWKSHGWRNLVGCSPWGGKESDTTERLHFHFSLSCIGEGNGNPLQCSCLENPRDRGTWWATIYGVTQNRAQLKRLSSSSSTILFWIWFAFSWWLVILSIFSCACWPSICMSSSEKCLFISSANPLIGFVFIDLYELFIYFGH